MSINGKMVIAAGLLFLAVGIGWRSVVYTKNLHRNEKFFNQISADYSTFDRQLSTTTGTKVDYDQVTECYYWFEDTDDPLYMVFHGPTGCFNNRAYYVPVQNYREALSLEAKLVPIITSSFGNVQNDSFSMQAPVQQTSTSGQSFIVTDSPSTSGAIPGACDVFINYPQSDPFNDLPVRHEGHALQLVTSCGGNAAKAYYQFRSGV